MLTGPTAIALLLSHAAMATSHSICCLVDSSSSAPEVNQEEMSDHSFHTGTGRQCKIRTLPRSPPLLTAMHPASEALPACRRCE